LFAVFKNKGGGEIMARCLIWRLLLLPAVCLVLVLSGCAGVNPTARDSLKTEGNSKIETNCQGENSTGVEVVTQSSVFPSEVEGLQLVSTSSGEEAYALMNGYLGSEVDIKGAYIAGYRGQNVDLVFWIVEMWEEQSAVDLLEQMNSRIKKSAIFTGYECFTDELIGQIYYARVKDDHPVFTHNYFYYKQNKVYWVNVSGDESLAILKKFIPSL